MTADHIATGRGYSEDEFAALEAQVDASNAQHGIAWTTNQLRQALAERRRVRSGALNGIALLRHIDALAADLEQAERERDEALELAKFRSDAVQRVSQQMRAAEARVEQLEAGLREANRLLATTLGSQGRWQTDRQLLRRRIQELLAPTSGGEDG